MLIVSFASARHLTAQHIVMATAEQAIIAMFLLVKNNQAN
jgi:hypothetical protein